MDPPLYERGGFVGAAARFYRRTYIADYVGFILLVAAYMIVSQDESARMKLSDLH